ncbi:ECF-type sigma factor [Rubrivivax gelatinosus]|uniref:Putative RNA polymerase sigma factor n=1 Tax=Rubrivivax gelatinosus (strain NBRC 100245 / IL144) TaxID=983917 RepID=I0HV38_RUBGI|nr:ECF-type sigma factor [Rubrivivax gelatinosus]MBG6078808.1 RNA polymerase sigma factor (TIGR02999 family) [Rubrivivax gelatinosus]BAL96875.1 putative RNA polymerase sigma factor [Rubrivivax gelatinosus IL144]
MGEITALLHRARDGERAALDALFERLYPELRRLARARLAGSRRGPEMGTTVLVHECYLKLVATGELAAGERAHFMAYAAHVMRSVIVDAVRAAQRERRGGDAVHVTLDTALHDSVPAPEHEILDVDAALAELARLDPRLVQVVEMRYFGGLKETEIAAALGVTERTVRRDWDKARLLLASALRG